MNPQQPSDTSFEEVIEALGPALRSYLERMVGDPELADDLFQEASIKIAAGLTRFEGRSTIKTWVFQIAHRVCIDHFRSSRGKQTVVEFLEEAHATPETEHDEAIVIDEMNQCIRDVIDSLPPEYRTALVLHDLEGLTGEEVADVSDCSLATAKIRIHRARSRLHAALQDHCQFYRDRNQVLRCDRKGLGDSND
jgi:RNA polymerase sigma-70 factor (ECF subfamily)